MTHAQTRVHIISVPSLRLTHRNGISNIHMEILSMSILSRLDRRRLIESNRIRLSEQYLEIKREELVFQRAFDGP